MTMNVDVDMTITIITHHHADEVFTSMGKETIKTIPKNNLEDIFKKHYLSSEEIWRYLACKRYFYLHLIKHGCIFDLVPGEYEVRVGPADYTGRICVIGKDLLENKICELFGVE